MTNHSIDHPPKVARRPKYQCRPALSACVAALIMAACGDDGSPQPVFLNVNRTLNANGFEVRIGQVIFAPRYAWTRGGSVEHGQAIVVSLRITNVVGPPSNAYSDDLLYLVHPKQGDGPSISYPVEISNDLVYPGEFREVEVVFPLEGSYRPDSLKEFALEMKGTDYQSQKATVFFSGASAPDGNPVPFQAGLKLQGTFGFEVTRAELRTDYPCLHKQAIEGTRVLHIAATITVPENAPDDAEERKRLFFGLEAYDAAGAPLNIMNGVCPPRPDELLVTRPMVQQNVIFDLFYFPDTPFVTLRYAGAEGKLELQPTARYPETNALKGPLPHV